MAVATKPGAQHARLAPSSAHRWTRCPGSIRLSEPYPDEDTEASLWGSACHELAERSWKSGLTADAYIASLPSTGRAAYDNEMTYVVDGFHGLLESIVDATAWYVETRLTAPEAMHPDVWGTADALAVVGSCLFVADLKTGRVPVDAAGNEQLACYMILAATRHAAKRKENATYRMSTQDLTRVTGVIYQPRAGGTKRWSLTIAELRQWRKTLAAAAVAASRPDAPCIAGAHCLYCPAAGACATAAAWHLAQIPIITAPAEDAHHGAGSTTKGHAHHDP